ncbi:GNAT family N-acetyltransferase [Nonomuraea sp. NPDC049269]|uniref:GNAT family N-acetyltransferase n=1 Tax=Nonomuraea sp. NPDC049269 TaxID=3364349 RepID=UPI003721850B
MINVASEWTKGWAISRGAGKPVAEPWGWRIEVEGIGRYVVTDLQWLEKLLPTVTEQGAWLKLFVSPEEAAPYLTQGWERTDPGFMMTVDLDRSEPRCPAGYEIEVATSGAATFVRILTAGGEQAARGQMGCTGETVVVDKVLTEEPHQRRGLGTVVMRTLQNLAIDQGVSVGVLGGTSQGRALYERLGWRVASPLTSFQYGGAQP